MLYEESKRWESSDCKTSVAKYWLSKFKNKNDYKRLKWKTIQSKHYSDKSSRTKWLNNLSTIKNNSSRLSSNKELRSYGIKKCSSNKLSKCNKQTTDQYLMSRSLTQLKTSRILFKLNLMRKVQGFTRAVKTEH